MFAQADAHVLRLEEWLRAPLATLAAGAACLGTAERPAKVADVLAVDEAHFGLDRVGLVFEGEEASHGAKKLLLRDAY